jgi:hypothetical protein
VLISRKEVENSNGFAAGKTNEDARFRARLELLERAIFLKAWQEKSGWKKASADNLKSRILSSFMRLRGWRSYLFEIESNCGTVLALLMVHEKFGVRFDTKFLSDEQSVANLFYSVIRMTLSQNRRQVDSMPESGSPMDHLAFYSLEKNKVAFDFLIQTYRSKGKIKVHKLQLEFPEQVHTELLVEVGDFPAVARACHPTWDKLSWGMQSVKGLNQWPHPLA